MSLQLLGFAARTTSRDMALQVQGGVGEASSPSQQALGCAQTTFGLFHKKVRLAVVSSALPSSLPQPPIRSGPTA